MKGSVGFTSLTLIRRAVSVRIGGGLRRLHEDHHLQHADQKEQGPVVHHDSKLTGATHTKEKENCSLDIFTIAFFLPYLGIGILFFIPFEDSLSAWEWDEFYGKTQSWTDKAVRETEHCWNSHLALREAELEMGFVFQVMSFRGLYGVEIYSDDAISRPTVQGLSPDIYLVLFIFWTGPWNWDFNVHSSSRPDRTFYYFWASKCEDQSF